MVALPQIYRTCMSMRWCPNRISHGTAHAVKRAWWGISEVFTSHTASCDQIKNCSQKWRVLLKTSPKLRSCQDLHITYTILNSLGIFLSIFIGKSSPNLFLWLTNQLVFQNSSPASSQCLIQHTPFPKIKRESKGSYHTTRNMQHATCNTQHATDRSQRSSPKVFENSLWRNREKYLLLFFFLFFPFAHTIIKKKVYSSMLKVVFSFFLIMKQ